MKYLHPSRLNAACLAAASMLLLAQAPLAQPSASAEIRSEPIGPAVRSGAQARFTLYWEERGDRWAISIAATASVGLIERGRDAAISAVLDCQRGDYPGGGLGLLSLPFGRPGSRTDHCVR